MDYIFCGEDVRSSWKATKAWHSPNKINENHCAVFVVFKGHYHIEHHEPNQQQQQPKEEQQQQEQPNPTQGHEESCSVKKKKKKSHRRRQKRAVDPGVKQRASEHAEAAAASSDPISPSEVSAQIAPAVHYMIMMEGIKEEMLKSLLVDSLVIY